MATATSTLVIDVVATVFSRWRHIAGEMSTAHTCRARAAGREGEQAGPGTDVEDAIVVGQACEPDDVLAERDERRGARELLHVLDPVIPATWLAPQAGARREAASIALGAGLVPDLQVRSVGPGICA